jgi:hypothetical protein
MSLLVEMPVLSKFGLQTLSFLHQCPTLQTHPQRAGQDSRQLLDSAGQRTTTVLPTLRPRTQRLVMTDCGRPVWIGTGTTTTSSITAVVEGIELQRSGSLNAVAPHVGQGSKASPPPSAGSPIEPSEQTGLQGALASSSELGELMQLALSDKHSMLHGLRKSLV